TVVGRLVELPVLKGVVDLGIERSARRLREQLQGAASVRGRRRGRGSCADERQQRAGDEGLPNPAHLVSPCRAVPANADPSVSRRSDRIGVPCGYTTQA